MMMSFQVIIILGNHFSQLLRRGLVTWVRYDLPISSGCRGVCVCLCVRVSEECVSSSSPGAEGFSLDRLHRPAQVLAVHGPRRRR